MSFVLRALEFHPVQCAVISSPTDIRLASMVTRYVIRKGSEDTAHQVAREIAEETNAPVLVVGSADLLDAVYRNGDRESIGGADA